MEEGREGERRESGGGRPTTADRERTAGAGEEEEEGTNEEGNGTKGGTEGRKEGSDEAGWKKQEDCSLMEEGRGGARRVRREMGAPQIS